MFLTGSSSGTNNFSSYYGLGSLLQIFLQDWCLIHVSISNLDNMKTTRKNITEICYIYINIQECSCHQFSFLFSISLEGTILGGNFNNFVWLPVSVQAIDWKLWLVRKGGEETVSRLIL